MKILIGLLAVAALMTGCDVIKDYKTGSQSPVEEGELTPLEKAKPYADIVSAVYPPAGGAVLIVLTAIFAWLRGRRINAGIPHSKNPVTKYWGIPVFLEGPIQNLSTLLRGLFTVGPNGSGLRAGWGVSLALGLGSLLIPLMFYIPGWSKLLVNHEGAITITLGILTSLIAGIRNELDKVLPLKPGVIA